RLAAVLAATVLLFMTKPLPQPAGDRVR
ncbi:MAG: hypothetical protein QOE64_1118, partial [Frankiales bacterium]|nr:hypothetical protein [Frankiales bacterium]